MICTVGLGTLRSAAEIHVSPHGDDANSGTADKPLATMAGAQRAARAAVGREPVTVRLHSGIYYLPETIRFTTEDSGCTYAAAPGEVVTLSGGTRLSLKWEPFRGNILQAKTPAGLAVDQLFVNGRRQMMARYPNYNPSILPYGGFAADAFSRDRAARWSDPTGGFIHAMQESHWGGFEYQITGKDAQGNVVYEGGWQNNRPSAMHPTERYVENIFEELDAPGEWFHNAQTGILYFDPPADVNLKTATVEVVRLRTLVEFAGTPEKPVRNVVLRGLIFCHTARTFMDTQEPLLRSDWTIYRGGAVLFNGTADCTLIDCEVDQPGGNAIFVNNYNRRVTLRSCHIHDTGASAVAFVGDPKAVRNPLFQYGQSNEYDKLDKTPGPQTGNYPQDCTVVDCLIHDVGKVEKQVAGVEISMAMGIVVSYCSIYGTARAGINISEGTFGGHLIEFCDVFDTVRETGDHGSFNSWGRDRYWNLAHAPAGELPALARLDMVKPNVIRNSRWRCDNGWDVDLDDGSSNYEIYNNLFLHGGLKLREGFHRRVWNNIAVNNSLHMHVWFENSGDEVTRNIWMGPYRSALMHPVQWGKEVDNNLFTTSEADRTEFASHGCDLHSLVGDPQFVNVANGDFRVKDGSPARKLGFVSFPMDQFGVRSPHLRAIARTPIIPTISTGGDQLAGPAVATPWRGVLLRELQNDEFSAVGVAAGARGVLVSKGGNRSQASQDGVRVADFIQRVNGRTVCNVSEFLDAVGTVAAGEPLQLTVIRDQQAITYEVKK